MGASVQVFRQLCIMLLYMLVGYTLYKKKILTEAGSKELAAMLVKIIIPAVIINSFCSEYTPEKAQKIALSALGAALLLGVSILMSRFCIARITRWPLRPDCGVGNCAPCNGGT